MYVINYVLVGRIFKYGINIPEVTILALPRDTELYNLHNNKYMNDVAVFVLE